METLDLGLKPNDPKTKIKRGSTTDPKIKALVDSLNTDGTPVALKFSTDDERLSTENIARRLVKDQYQGYRLSAVKVEGQPETVRAFFLVKAKAKTSTTTTTTKAAA